MNRLLGALALTIFAATCAVAQWTSPFYDTATAAGDRWPYLGKFGRAVMVAGGSPESDSESYDPIHSS
jgi:hypothetical protein